MSQSIQIQVTQVGLEQSIAAAMKRVGSSSQINLGTSSKQINALSQPLGRITGQADEFSKSMAAANARVLAFGASAGIITGVSKAMSGLVASTIKVEKSLTEINSVLNKSGAELDKFGQQIFNVAKNTGKSFDEVANGALELARQGLNAEDTLARLNDALILSRLSGLDATQSVEGLTAAFNSFKKSGITTAEILNKVVAVSQKYAVSERDIIEGVKRSASVAQQAGVSFEELAAVITAVQQTTARGGAVIGNSFKTIFARIQRKDVLADLQNMGVAVTDLQGNVLPALRVLENLAAKLNNFSQIEQASIAEKLGGVFQLDKLLAALKDISSEASVTSGALEAMAKAGNSAYQKNAVLNQTLAALLNKVAVSAEQLGSKLGEIGVTDGLKNVLGFFNSLLEGIQKVLGEESGLGSMVRGLVKGLGNFLSGPGLAIFGAIILKLSKDLVQFGFASLKTFFGIGKAAQEVKNVEGAISQILAKNVNLQQQLFALEGNRAAQLKIITGALVEQEALLRRSANISSGLGKPLYNAGVRATGSGLRIGNSADGYMPAVAKESKAIKQGVGGARSGDKPVVMPNFNFGGGKKGTMVAHTGEYVVPNFNGSGGSAVFNRQMVQSMGLPSRAKKINAAGGLVPNFANVVKKDDLVKYTNYPVQEVLSKKGSLQQINKVDTIDQFSGLVEIIYQKRNDSEYNKATNKLIGQFWNKEDKDGDNEKLNRILSSMQKKGVDPQYLARIRTGYGNRNYDYLRKQFKGALGELDAKNLSGQQLASGNAYMDLVGGGEVKTTLRTPFSGIASKIMNSYLLNGPNLKNITKNGKPKLDRVNAKKLPIYMPIGGTIDLNAASGFIPNFAPKFNAETVRKYANEIEKYKLPTKDFYQFPDGTGGYGSQIKNVLSRQQSKAVANQQIKEKKIEDKGFFNLNADALGGILLVSPRFGKGQGSLDTSMQIGEIPFFNQDKSLTVDKNKYIKLAGIKTSNTPSGRDLKSLRADVNELFSDGIVKLAYRLYGETFDPASGGEFSSKLQSLDASRKQQLLPPAAQGDLFEAAGKVALNSFANLESLFGAGEQNRPFDFQNPEALRKVFGVSAKRGEAKRGGEKNFSSSKQVQGIIKKIFNDSEYGPSAVKSLKSQGAFNLSEAQKAAQAKNAFNGFIPNFAYKVANGEISDPKRPGNYLSFERGKGAFDIDSISAASPREAARMYKVLVGEARRLGLNIQNISVAPQFRSKEKAAELKRYLPRIKTPKGQITKILETLFPELKYSSKSGAKNTRLEFIDTVKGFTDNSEVTIDSRNPLSALASNLSKRYNPQSVLEAIYTGDLGISSITDTAAGGFIPNFAGGTPNRGVKFTALQIAKGLGQAAIKILIDQYLGDGVVDSVEASGLSQMKPSDAKFFIAELKIPAKNKHRQAFEKALIADPEMQAAYPKYYQQLSAQIEKYKRDNAAGGFLPNFANPLQDAVNREMAAGVPASQIYIDKSPALKNAANPMGLMVANRRDEPAGGFQGISRARREGANPMTYGAAGGFVPNYAAGNDSGGTSKVLATLFLFQTAVSVASGFFEEAGESGRKLSETLQKVASTALIFGGIALSGPMKSLKKFSDSVLKSNQALTASQPSKTGFFGGLSRGFKSGLSGMGSEFVNPALQGRDAIINRAGTARKYNLSSAGFAGGRIGAVTGGVTRGIGAVAAAPLGPIVATVGIFKVAGEALSGFRTYSNAAAKSLGEMSVYAAKASESLSELDRTAIEAETNRRYGVTGGTLLGSISDMTGASAIASGITGRQISNTNYRGRNVELSNVSEDTFKQIEKAFITSYVGANRTKFATAEDAASVAAAEFSKKFGDGFDEFDAEYIKNDIKELSEEAQRFQKDNAVAEALRQAKIQSELAARDIINFNNVLGDSANKIIQLKAKVFELKSSNEIFKALSEASTENASNLSEFEKVAQKLGTTLQSLDASKAVQELDLITKTTENIDNNIKTNLKGLTVQEIGLGKLYSEIKDLITSGNVDGINQLINDETKKTDITKLFGGDYRTVLQDLTKEYANQTTEIKNQAKEAQNNANIEAYRSALAQQTTSALESQTKQLDLQKLSFEKISEYADKIKASTSKISDLNFEKGLIGATQRQRLSAQISRRPELESRVREESLRNFQKDRISSVQSLESLIPSTLSSDLQFQLKNSILEATKSIRNQNTLGGVAEEANKKYAETVKKINDAVQEETNKRSDFINQIRESLVGGSATFKDSVVAAAQEFARIIKVSSLAPKELELKELQTKKQEAQKDLESRNEAIAKYISDRDKYIKTFEENNGKESLMRSVSLENDPGYLELTSNLDKSQKSFLDLNTAITKLEEKIQAFSPVPITTTSSFIPPLLRRPLEAPKTIPLPTTPPGGTVDPLEAAKLEEKAALLEIANTTENASDELEKLTSVSRILAEEFTQLKDGIPAVIAAIISQRNKSISGAEILGANYDLETNRQLAGAKTQEEYDKITRDRKNKGIGQLFAEEYGKTPEEQALDLKKTIVDGSVQFKNNMIEAMMGAAEGTTSLKEGLRSAAYEFVKMLNQKVMSQLIDKIVGGSVGAGGGASSGGLIQGIGSVFSSMFGSGGMASGGMINGGSGTKDDVPAMLMGGEYVVNKKAVSKYGPQFLEAINNGTLSGYANGGMVSSGSGVFDKMQQARYDKLMQRVESGKAIEIQRNLDGGGFYTPGTYGQGAIYGKGNLLDFATQSGTSGKFDRIINESGYQSIDLESESSRLSVLGMRNSPAFAATQAAKGQAFDLYLQQYRSEIEAKKQAKEQKKALRNQLIMLAASAALGPVMGAVGGAIGAGAKAAFGAAKASGATTGQALWAGVKGTVTGGRVLGQQVGGLSNLFSGVGKAFTGDFSGAANQFKLSQISNDGQLISMMQSNPSFAKSIGGMSGLDFSGVKRAAIAPELGRFSATRANASISTEQSRGYGVTQTGNINNLGMPPPDRLPRRPNKYEVGKWSNRIGYTGIGAELLPVPKKNATGGIIPSTSGIDTVPAMLSGGEFVMNRSAVQSIGAPNLQSMNAGGTSITSEETSKELNERLLAKLDELIKVSESGSGGAITINVDSSGKENQQGGSQDASGGRQQLARQIKDAVLQVINEEKRIGGSLRR